MQGGEGLHAAPPSVSTACSFHLCSEPLLLRLSSEQTALVSARVEFHHDTQSDTWDNEGNICRKHYNVYVAYDYPARIPCAGSCKRNLTSAKRPRMVGGGYLCSTCIRGLSRVASTMLTLMQTHPSPVHPKPSTKSTTLPRATGKRRESPVQPLEGEGVAPHARLVKKRAVQQTTCPHVSPVAVVEEGCEEVSKEETSTEETRGQSDADTLPAVLSPPPHASLSEYPLLDSFATMHWHIERSSHCFHLRPLQSEWWALCQSPAANVADAWSRLKTLLPGAKASKQRTVAAFKATKLVQQTELVFRDRLKAMNLDVGGRLVLAVVKLLRSPSGAGRQKLHFDVPSTQKVRVKRCSPASTVPKASQCYSCILHLNPTDTQGTHVPLLSAEQMKPLFSAKDAEWQRRVETLCKPSNFSSHVMHSGDLLMFRTDVPHYGPANMSSSDRWVLYTMFSAEEGPDQDARQEFIEC